MRALACILGFAGSRHVSDQQNLNADSVTLDSVSTSEGWSKIGKSAMSFKVRWTVACGRLAPGYP